MLNLFLVEIDKILISGPLNVNVANTMLVEMVNVAVRWVVGGFG